MFQALERIRKGAPEEAENGVHLLRDATDLCPDLADAWYYRSLFERKLNHLPKAEFALNRARLLESEALRDNLDPFTLAAPPTPPTPTSNPKAGPRQKWALVVGISQFQDPQVPHLSFTGKDAEDFAAVLKDPQVGRFSPANVHMLLDKDATTHNIKTELNWLARSATADDLVVIFVATHGSGRELDSRDVNYIVTHDTTIKPQDELFATALGMVELTQVVRSRVLARRTVILLDTCHSGAAASNSTSLVESSVSSSTLDSIREGAGRVIVASSQVGESSWEDDADQNGYFTHYLLEALRQNKGMNPINDVFNYVHDQVEQTVKAKYKVKQEPVLSRSGVSDEIVIGVQSGGM